MIGLVVLFGILPAARISADTGTGSISLTTLGSPVSENFDTLANTGTTNTTLPAGWYLTEQGGGARDNEQYGADNGGSNTGDIYSYGTTSTTERAFGALRSGTLIPFIGARFTNNTAGTITSLDISYTGEEWRLGTAARTDRIDFQYSLNATDLTTGTYTDVDQLDFTTPNTTTTGAKDGNAVGNRTSISFTVTGLSIANGTTFFIRWIDLDATGADDGLSVDNFSLTPNGSGGGGQPTLSINDVTVTETNAGTTTASFTVSLSAPGLAGGVTFDIATQNNSATTADNDYVGRALTGQTITEGNQSYTFDVTVNGDMTVEPNETFFVNVTNVTGASVGDTQGVGTISNDDFTATPIHTIQGSGNSSPFAGNVVTTTGIVTGVKTNGFFLQEPDAGADANPNTSEGVFVFTSSAPPAAAAVGNSVAVMGMVQEFIPSQDPNSPPLTEIAGSPTVTLLSTGNPLPAAITLTAADTSPSGTIEQLEKFEGMRVRVNSLTAVAPTQGSITEPSATSSSNGVFYGVITGVARPFREPGVAVPDPLPAGSPCCVPRFDANPERLRVDSDGLVGGTRLEVTSGATVTNLTGPLDYAFRTYTILPDVGTPPSVSGNISAIPVPVPATNEFTVASFNIQRFYDTVNDPGGDVVLTTTAFNNRLNKASLTIRNVMRSPDIIGVEEMENLAALQTLATKINNDTVAGGGTNPNYQPYLSEGNDVGLIDVGFLVKASRVSVIDVTQFGKDTLYTEPGGGMALLNDRPPLVLRATVNAPNPMLASFPITVIVNHLRSLNGIDDPADGNRVRTKRRAQAEFLANLIQPRQATENIVSVGDYNAFEFSDGYVDVIGTIKGTPTPANEVVLASIDLVNPDLTDLIAFAAADQKYSYSFDGNAQTLDHELITANLLTRFAHINYARNDADFPESFRNDPNRPERITDHDLPVAYFTFPLACNITCPANITRSNDSNQCGAVVTFSPSSTGDCGTITCSPASGSFFPVGTTTVTCSSSTGQSCSFSVTVNDTQAPSITCPANITSPNDPNQCSAVVTYPAPTVTDNCPGTAAPKGEGATVPPLTPVCTPASGSIFPQGVTTVTCTVNDVAGNSSSCSFTVTVNDTQPPAITCPANITRPTDPNQCTAVVSFAPTVSDNCTNGASATKGVTALAPICSPASGSTFPKGTTTVICSVSDASGNQASCTFAVTANDTQPPVFANGCLANIYTAAAASCPIANSKVISYTYPAATDNCPGVTVTCNPPTGSTFPPGTTTVTCTAADSSGNTASCSFQVSVFSACLVDETNPGNVVLFNSTTGDYRYCCDGVVVASGRGTLNVRGCSLTIDEAKGDRRVRITADTTANSGAGAGTAFFQRLGGQSCQIMDRSMVGNTCPCN